MGRKVKLISKSRDTFSVLDFLVDCRRRKWSGDVVETRRAENRKDRAGPDPEK
jgi:hypothetical protein